MAGCNGGVRAVQKCVPEESGVGCARAWRFTDSGRLCHVHADASRTIQSDCTHTGSFATASCPSPIKWKDEKYRRFGFPSKKLLDTRRKRDPTEWENGGSGPSDFSTSFGMSWLAPQQQEDKCNARATLSTSSSSALEKASLTSGWRENNTNREHPWIHPGVPDTTETTYRLTNRIPAKRGGRSEIAPMPTSGYARSARKIVFGRSALLPEEQMSTTHLNYLAGRTNVLSGTVVDLRPGEKVEDGFAQSGFCKNLPHPMEVFPRSSAGELPPEVLYSTATQSSFSHPSKFRTEKPIGVDCGKDRIMNDATSAVPLLGHCLTAARDAPHPPSICSRSQCYPSHNVPCCHSCLVAAVMLSAAGLPSSYGRAVIPVNRLHSVEAPTLNQLHPSVAQVDFMTRVVHCSHPGAHVVRCAAASTTRSILLRLEDVQNHHGNSAVGRTEQDTRQRTICELEHAMEGRRPISRRRRQTMWENCELLAPTA
jgi:hypothetical protein